MTVHPKSRLSQSDPFLLTLPPPSGEKGWQRIGKGYQGSLGCHHRNGDEVLLLSPLDC